MPGEQRVLDLCNRVSQDMKWNDDRAGLELAIKLDTVIAPNLSANLRGRS